MTPTDVGQHLIDFVHDRDVPCPSCGYALRNLQSPVCPECGEELTLRVGLEHARIRLLLLALLPGSGGLFLAVFLSVMLWVELGRGRSYPPWEFWVVFIYCWLSGLITVILALRARWFMRCSLKRKWGLVLMIWVPTLIFFVWFLASVFR